ncbi:MAG: 1-acyl-sn-glycerol-3-phosphate acyltransferase [Bacteroidales bacterium]|nr:1-acyl-sn-glycerol-3-phosphate acyltransferase [Bacteroidales bacterium]
MSDLIIYIYHQFNNRRWLFYLFLALISGAIIFFAAQIRFEEDISRSISSKPETDKAGYVVKNLKQTDQLIINISLDDTLRPAEPEALIEIGQSLVDSLNIHLDTNYIHRITFMAADSTMISTMNLVLQYLPSFFDEKDYLLLDSLLSPDSITKALEKDLKILVSPASMVLKKRIQQDPLGISNIALEKFKSLKGGNNFDLYNGCIFTRDLRHLLIFIIPANSSTETSRNEVLIKELDYLIKTLNKSHNGKFNIQYFGGVAVAVCNATQLKKDIFLTLTIAIFLIFCLIGWYFRSIKVPILGLLPAIFGGGLALALLYLFKGSISAISLGIGSVILGLIVDYTLYIVNQFRKTGDIPETLRAMSLTILLCCLTTAGAFLCLPFLNSAVLHDLGWFAAISVTGAAFFALIILPHFLSPALFRQTQFIKPNFIDRIAGINLEKNLVLIILFLILAGTSFYFSSKVTFETNLTKLNFITPKLAKAETDLDKISDYKLKNLFLVAIGNDPQTALRNQDRLTSAIHTLQRQGILKSVSNAGFLLTSDSLQSVRISRWNSFWTPERKKQLRITLVSQSTRLGFKKETFDSFLALPDKQFHPLSINALAASGNPMATDWISQSPTLTMLPNILKVKEEDKVKVYHAFPSNTQYILFDKQSLTDQFVENVKSDFDRLVKLSMLFVTLLLILSFGRLGIGLITAIPMYLSWFLTLGLMGLTGIRFNIFNIIISSFIFGLGVDYSILMMRGLQHSLKYGDDEIKTYKVSILLSSITTLFGVGALFFARHPALHSIALISVIGIVLVVILTFIFLPLIFHSIILSRTRNGKFPITLRILVKTLVTWGNIVLIAVILMILGSFIYLLFPIKRKKKELLFHYLFSRLTRAYIAFTFAFDRKLINEPGEDFKKPAIIISNHQSLIETPAFLQLYPKILILTTSWVYRSPVFGPIARLANFYNVDSGIEKLIGLLKEKVKEGYSVLIFPEAHRSYDQQIHRFHRGAFYLAEKLELDILPILVFGSGDFLAKDEFWGKPNSFRMKVLPRVGFQDTSMGASFQERSREFRKYYIDQYALFKAAEGTGTYYRRNLLLNYDFKGPILEWYLRVKLKLEKNYEIYHQMLPLKGEILDLGCGYGFISYMLLFTGDDRKIIGVDYDPEKIAIASNCYSKNDRIHFECADISTIDISPKDGFLLSDVLHYLPLKKQENLLRRCFYNLRPGGAILIREANADLADRHQKSIVTEFFSTHIGFNKTAGPDKKLYFTSAETIHALATECGMTMEIIDNKKITSNNLFLVRKKR